MTCSANAHATSSSTSGTLDGSRADVTNPPASDHTELVGPGVTLFGLRVDGELLAIGALEHLDDVHAEVR
jgi:hypothetical protein